MARSSSTGWLAGLAIAAATLAMAVGCSNKGGEGKAFTIGVIPKGTTHEFWKAIHAGAVKAERELNAAGTRVTITWKGPLREDDREQQVQVVEGFSARASPGL